MGLIRAHLGCGNRRIHGASWINVDCQFSPAVDRVGDIRQMSRLLYPGEMIEAGIANAVLEHLFLDEVRTHLVDVADRLADPGFMLYTGLPDFWQIVNWIREHTDAEWLLQHNLWGHPEKEDNRQIQIHKYAVTRHVYEEATRGINCDVAHGLHGWLDEPFCSCRALLLYKGTIDWAKLRQARTEYWELNRLRFPTLGL